jgi:hypothetical protein
MPFVIGYNVCSGGLEPHFRVLFSAVSMYFPGEFPSGWKSVESSRSKSLVFFGQPAYMFYVRLNHFRAVKIPVKRVFDPGHGYLGVRARLTLGLGKRWHAAREIDSRRPWYWFTPRALVAGLAKLD